MAALTNTSLPLRPRIGQTEGLELLQQAPLHVLGRRAFAAKKQLYGNRATYIRNMHVNPTNLCIFRCRFCDFSAKPQDVHAYSLDENEIVDRLKDPTILEAHIVGGLWHTWGFQRSLGLVRRIRSARPDLWIKAFTAVEVDYFARMERISWRNVIDEMRAAGVDAMPGGGAEVLSERVHRELYPDKVGPESWLAIHETAHQAGLPTNATLLFGHIETDEEIIDHLLRIRALQDRTAGFQSFIPLAYQPGRTGLVDRPVSAPRSLRIVALSRLLLDNIPHVKAYWPTLGIETAAAALSFGADDLDGTLGKERIMQLAGSEAPAALSDQLMHRIIHEAGQIPVERDGQFHIVAASRPRAAECRA